MYVYTHKTRQTTTTVGVTTNRTRNPVTAFTWLQALSPLVQLQSQPAEALWAPGRAGQMPWVYRTWRVHCGMSPAASLQEGNSGTAGRRDRKGLPLQTLGRQLVLVPLWMIKQTAVGWSSRLKAGTPGVVKSVAKLQTSARGHRVSCRQGLGISG